MDDDLDTVDETPSPVSDDYLDRVLTRGRVVYCPDCYSAPCNCAGEYFVRD